MDDRTESLEQLGPESYEWDYEEAEDRGPKILWGRVVALGVLAAAAFWLGRTTAPEGIGERELARARADAAAARAEVETLEQQLAAQSGDDDAAAGASPSPTPEETEGATGKTRTYVVRSGDTLVAIAVRFYDDASLDDYIAEANGIEDPAEINVGQELIIPPPP